MKPRSVLGFVAVMAWLAAGAMAPASSQEIVFDPSRAADFIQEFAKIQEQLATTKAQLTEAEKMFASVTGNRGFGDLLRDGNLQQYLPENAKGLYDGSGGGIGISGSISDILKQEDAGVSGSIPEAEARLEERARQAAATDKAVALKGYEGAKARLEQIEALMDQIKETQDPKALGELQVRLAGEQAAIQVELNKLQLVAQLQSAEERLIAEQRRALSRRILDPTIQAMPSINGPTQ